MWTEEQIRNDVYDMLCDALCVEREEIRPDSRFFADLGGESIELLEMSFRCGKHFGIDPQFQKLIPAAELQVDRDNRLTPAAIAMIRERAPFLDLSEFARNPHIDHASDLITVKAICDCMCRLIRERADAGARGDTAATMPSAEPGASAV